MEVLFRIPTLIGVGHGWLVTSAATVEEADGYVELDLPEPAVTLTDRMGLPFTLLVDETRQARSLNLDHIGGVIMDFAEHVIAYKGLSDKVIIHAVRFAVKPRIDPVQAAIFEPLLRAQEVHRQLLASELVLMRNPELDL